LHLLLKRALVAGEVKQDTQKKVGEENVGGFLTPTPRRLKNFREKSKKSSARFKSVNG